MKVLVATEKPFAQVAVDGIRKEVESAGNTLELLEKYTDASQLLDAVKDADALIVRSDKVTPAVLDAANNLKIVVRAGAGYDNVDIAYAKEKGVVVENTPDRIQMRLLNLYSDFSYMRCAIFIMASRVQNC